MIILPAIDLKDGKCVRLYKGDFNKSEVVSESPLETAFKFKKEGAEFIHMVDLDGALKGKGVNYDIVSKIIKEVNVPVELGGGIRDMETIEFLINIGVSRVILGTAALNNSQLVKSAVNKYGEKIAVGIDAKNGYAAVDGWTNVSIINYIDFAVEMERIGVKTIIFTDISKDGTLQGPNLEQLEELGQSVRCNIIASGGIKSIEDLKNLKKMGLYGAITGKGIYSGNIDLKEAINLCR
ncbi:MULTISPECIES: 1-(5-phosphoribosyl)-5-[(5-phosphoribosylamino)methylideneamino]imidazole-4-carboxamide isomerase [Clostridium]|uniref:1-(5-phosphoribosyl)-5-[(5-phosphoribosylamino)methylideneamino] imidazole-4-carboxamide isomerase n=2 Tax=Clostridium TaxID=1485 RepID=A0A151AMD4_9CLOT|nr:MULTISPECIES: 1-(5-phosphoribosyl)-5-[(5-phosphoribosylamino)methylideneamino]imidazole-4-carboxamide isomerase [Clostridium]KYH28762.1 1-(5-phosphoribosyl)-5-[(5-phosphoribosylamino)methylideneamino] imidazole-4-carboxamide isomerase [Clostridium colicanis DSM 13634]MBE6043374.1 1-(5-phosphoribosyl)-5-[(5-phosphoribosylamino)methylideneamino]imidazole-4-carboxamide isomerase [Clostridium thermopalmarium]PRR76125.1 1-(5-phosphoribosyl)-5-[(5-phosphoribosylamino)methylideneamino] imidazole-4-c